MRPAIRNYLVLLAVLVQLAFPAWMAVKREWIARNAPVVWLRTAPVDPRDPFRGDYVTLDYEISRLPKKLFGKGLTQMSKPQAGTELFTALRVGSDGVAEATGVDVAPPSSGPYIKGRITEGYWDGADFIPVEYGIERYYVQEGKGKEIEDRRGNRSGLQTPMEVAIALSADGMALLKTFRWLPLAIGVQITGVDRNGNRRFDERGNPVTPDPSVRKTGIAVVKIKNVDTEPHALVLPPGDAAFTLVPAFSQWSHTTATVPPRPAPAPPTDADVRILASGEEITISIDLAQPAWHVRKNPADATLVEAGTLDWGEMFRLVYAAPPPEAISHLKNAERVWPGRLPTATAAVRATRRRT